MRVEVDKTSGSVFTLDVLIYNTNKYVDLKKEYIGKQVAVNGFVDSFVEKDGKTTLKLVAQNVMIIGGKTTKFAENAKAQEGDVSSQDVVDDDLPF